MLVVNAAVAAINAGHDVIIYTSHHDNDRCFRDTTGDGKRPLGFRTYIWNGWLVD